MKNGETINVLSFNLLKILIPLGFFVCFVTPCGGGGSRDDGTKILSFTTAATAAEVEVGDVLLSDDFSNGDIYNWTVNFVDDSAGIGNSSKWEIVSGQLRQSYFVANVGLGDPFNESYHLGTFTYPNTGMSWQDYRFSVDVTPLPDTGLAVQGNDVGVMFRYQDINNYYRLSLSARYGFTRLEKKVAGSFSTLAVDSRGYYDNETLHIIIEVKGDLIQVFVDDEPLFSVSDSDLNSGTIGLYSQDKLTFDNVLVTQNNPIPTIIISSPVAYSVITTNTLAVSALGTNLPVGASVQFVLDDTNILTDASPPYTALFTNVPQGEHKVDAILRDNSDAEIARDTNERIGVEGDYYLAVGDSITNGFGDSDPSDNTSQDGRTIASQGYEAPLNDLLTSTLSFPHIVYNEGIGGDGSSDALNERIDSILERHPDANKVLVLLGTNDAYLGVSQQDYESNMKNLIKEIVDAGKEVWVAEIPFSKDADGTIVDQRIQDYNDIIIPGLISGFQIGPDSYAAEEGPDFYTFFEVNQNALFDPDGLHPNALGHAAMAQEWHDLFALPVTQLVFTPVTPCRIVDTRLAGGAIPPGGIRSYSVYGDVASQGGNPAGCASPQGEPRAVVLNVTAVPLGNGNIVAYPFGAAVPNASLVNYRSDAQNIANSGTVKTCFNCTKDISIKSRVGTTHVVIDVLGYYYPKP